MLQVAQSSGILLDPVYSLAAWQASCQASRTIPDEQTIMLHSGGALGLHGIAQTHASWFI